MDPYADLHARIDRACERAAVACGPELVEEMNALLSEGYANALMDERRLVELDERAVEALMTDEGRPGGRLRALRDERHALAHAIAGLREHLADMHERYLALRVG
jgi:hypothetical protein